MKDKDAIFAELLRIEESHPPLRSKFADDVTICLRDNDSLQWGMILSWTEAEIIQGHLGTTMKYEGMLLKFEMDAEDLIYQGDKEIPGLFNLTNCPRIDTVKWVNEPYPRTLLLDHTAIQIAECLPKDRDDYVIQLRVPIPLYAKMAMTRSSTSIESYLKTFTHNLTMCIEYHLWKESPNKTVSLNIQPNKWINNRAVVFLKDEIEVSLVRPRRATEVRYEDKIYQVIYFGWLGRVRPLRPRSVVYFDGVI